MDGSRPLFWEQEMLKFPSGYDKIMFMKGRRKRKGISMNIIEQISRELAIEPWQTEAVVTMIDEGDTIPFIARYRKEKHGSLNDEMLRSLSERLQYLRNLEEKKLQVLGTIEGQGKLTGELKKLIEEAMTQVALEDLYRPYRPKRRTRATIAREKGLEGLAAFLVMQGKENPVLEAEKYVSEENGIETPEDALCGAKDILAEEVSDDAEYRAYIRQYTIEHGLLQAEAKDDSLKSVYEMYYHFEEAVSKIAGHRILAVNRGEKEKILTVKIFVQTEPIFRYLEKQRIVQWDSPCAVYLQEALEDSYQRLIAPAIERDIRNELTERAEDSAINVFGKNLMQLLMQPPVAGQVVLGWDPGYAHGCKLAVVDSTGKVLDTAMVFPTEPRKKVAETRAIVKKLIDNYHVTLIAIGNGTASRESEQFVADFLRESGLSIPYVIVNEAGASVYSASRLATEEFPQFEEWQRGAASMARRIQDPLAELVKIDPKSIGVGQYQHDMNQKKLAEALHDVVEDCVNKVGIDLNTASVSLLEYVSGISKAVAKNIVAYREEHGKFKNRRQLLKVAKLGPKAFEQAAGFLRILDGDNPLDATGVHPESYEAAEMLLDKTGFQLSDIRQAQKGGNGMKALSRAVKKDEWKIFAEEFRVGEITLRDIAKELEKPGRDPRDEMPKPVLRTDVLNIGDLKPGMVLKGTVRNVIDFGAFVDIGVHQDGLVHISQLSKDRFVKHPLEVVSVGDIVEVRVMNVDVEKGRIQLTMKC